MSLIYRAWRMAPVCGARLWGISLESQKKRNLHHQENVEMEVKNAAAYAVEKGIPFYFAKIACAQEGSRFAQKRSTLQWR